MKHHALRTTLAVAIAVSAQTLGAQTLVNFDLFTAVSLFPGTSVTAASQLSAQLL